jgi:hypothetical protein
LTHPSTQTVNRHLTLLMARLITFPDSFSSFCTKPLGATITLAIMAAQNNPNHQPNQFTTDEYVLAYHGPLLYEARVSVIPKRAPESCATFTRVPSVTCLSGNHADFFFSSLVAFIYHRSHCCAATFSLTRPSFLRTDPPGRELERDQHPPRFYWTALLYSLQRMEADVSATTHDCVDPILPPS